MDFHAHLDPELTAALAALPAKYEIELADVPSIREVRRLTYPQPHPEVRHADVSVPSRANGPEVPVRLHRPPADEAPDPDGWPCLFWLHGGGYMLGSFEAEEPMIDQWVLDLGYVVVTPDYRLAPECPFPAGLYDCLGALTWTIGNTHELGIDPSRIVVGGDSAGGGLAAALTQLARDSGVTDVLRQVLVYPMLDDREDPYASRRIESPRWGRRANDTGWAAYLGCPPGAADAPDYAVPARTSDLSRLPAAYIAVGGLDLFRDESIEYARRLLAADVQVELHLYPGAPHGFDVEVPAAAVSRRMRADLADYLTRAGTARR